MNYTYVLAAESQSHYRHSLILLYEYEYHSRLPKQKQPGSGDLFVLP